MAIPTFYDATGRQYDVDKEIDRLFEELWPEAATEASRCPPNSGKSVEGPDMPSEGHQGHDEVCADQGAPAGGNVAAVDGESKSVGIGGGSSGAASGSNGESKLSEQYEDKKSEPADTEGAKVPVNPRLLSDRADRGSPAPVSDSLVLRPWSRQIDQVRILNHQLALDTAGQSFPFTVRFDDALIAEALKTKKTFSTWANDRLAYYLEPLEKKLGRKITYYFTVEISRKGHLHIHGVIGIDEEHLGDLRRLLQRFSGGPCKGAGRKFVRLEPFNDNETCGGLNGSLGWARYMSKQFRRKTKDPRRGSQLVCRRSLNRRSQQIWEEIQADYKRECAAAAGGSTKS